MITTAWSFLWPCKLNGVIYLTWRDSSVILISSSYRFCFMDCLEYRIHFHAIFLWSMVSVIYAMKLWPIISKDTLRSERLWYNIMNMRRKNSHLLWSPITFISILTKIVMTINVYRQCTVLVLQKWSKQLVFNLGTFDIMDHTYLIWIMALTYLRATAGCMVCTHPTPSNLNV